MRTLSDYLANNLYWIDDVKGTIEVYSLNTKKRAIVQHYTGTDKPSALALIPLRGEMFVALESVDHFHIDRQMMKGGQDHRHVIETGLSKKGPIHFAVDEGKELVYWSDGDGKKIEFSDYNGQRRTLFAQSKRSPGPLAIISDELYWTSLKSKSLQWRDKSGVGGIKIISMDNAPGMIKTPNLINIAAGTPLKLTYHLCMVSNGGCSDICVSDGPTARSCLCETGHLFKDNTNTTCVKRQDCGFRCSSSGECLAMSQKCDNKVDCLDNSDESNCNATNTDIKCDATQFMCRNGKQCIPSSQRCDLHFNCDDRTDEYNCTAVESSQHCKVHQLKCPSGESKINCI